MTRKVHCVKITPKNFNDVISHKLSFQIRRFERDYKLGDYLHLQEFNGEVFTGRSVPVKINYILNEEEGLQKDYVLLNIETLNMLVHKGKRYTLNL